MILLYVAVVILIIRGQSPIISLLSLAILWAILAGVPGNSILSQVLDKGGTAYASAIVDYAWALLGRLQELPA
jgi:H+/gluconate symporter-like permease